MSEVINLYELRRKDILTQQERDFPADKLRPVETMIPCGRNKKYIKIEDCAKCEHFERFAVKINEIFVVCNYESE